MIFLAAALVAEFCTIYYGRSVPGALGMLGLLVIALTPATSGAASTRRRGEKR